MSTRLLTEQALEKGRGVLQLAPTWVPRTFCRPGKRLRLHPDDYYALGLSRGGIDERWLSSTVCADNGMSTPENEGLSYIVINNDNNERVALRDAVDILKGDIIGDKIWAKYNQWPMFAKFFDNMGSLPHHVHHRNEHAARVGKLGKPEMYFLPSQMNNHCGEFPYTFFGFNPGTSKEQVKQCLRNFSKGDNHILELSRAHKLALDTGWNIPPGVLHAPGSLCTYEPQAASDVFAMYQSILHGGHCVPEELLWRDSPVEELGNIDYLIEVLDWELNVDPDFYSKSFMEPISAKPAGENEGCIEEWICYKHPEVSAKRVTIFPEQTTVIRDNAAYGIICLQGFGKFGVHNLETPTLIKYGQITYDEYFVTEQAAKEGITVTNLSLHENIVFLQHFADNPDLKSGVHNA